MNEVKIEFMQSHSLPCSLLINYIISCLLSSFERFSFLYDSNHHIKSPLQFLLLLLLPICVIPLINHIIILISCSQIIFDPTFVTISIPSLAANIPVMFINTIQTLFTVFRISHRIIEIDSCSPHKKITL